jgi:hypothetical protein
MLEFDDRGRGLAAHIFDRILIAEPVGALDRVVHVPRPMVGAHVAKACGDPALRSYGMAAGRKDLRNAGRLEAMLGCAHGGAKAGTASSDHHNVIGVIDDLVAAHAPPPKASTASA